MSLIVDIQLLRSALDQDQFIEPLKERPIRNFTSFSSNL
jgi:hypothetical protein